MFHIPMSSPMMTTMFGRTPLGAGIHPADRGAPPVRTPPIRTEFEFPPLTPVAQIDRVLRWSEDERACFEHLRQSAGIFLRLRFPFRESQVPGFVYKFTKLPV